MPLGTVYLIHFDSPLAHAYHVVRIWRNVDRGFERRLKKQKHAWRLCPCCQPHLLNKRYRFHKH